MGTGILICCFFIFLHSEIYNNWPKLRGPTTKEKLYVQIN